MVKEGCGQCFPRWASRQIAIEGDCYRDHRSVGRSAMSRVVADDSNRNSLSRVEAAKPCNLWNPGEASSGRCQLDRLIESQSRHLRTVCCEKCPATFARQRLDSTGHPALKFLQCSYEHGVLVIEGAVQSYYLKQIAQECVRSIAGIERIINELRVRNTGEPSHS